MSTETTPPTCLYQSSREFSVIGLLGCFVPKLNMLCSEVEHALLPISHGSASSRCCIWRFGGYVLLALTLEREELVALL
jgi:hypothetical protein